jgi:calcium-dependent protein kinase
LSDLKNIEHNKRNSSNKFTSFSNFGIKLIDFGCSKKYKRKGNFHEIIGTLNYNSPEVLKNDYNEKSDIWSCGVIMYMLLSGSMPFSGDTDEELIKCILKGNYSFKFIEFEKVSEIAKDCIKNLLIYNKDERPSAEQILRHPFFEDKRKIIKYAETDLDSKNILLNLKKYRATTKFQQAVLTYLTHNFARKENIISLNRLFKKIDVDCNGKLSREEILKSYSKCGLIITKEDIDLLIEKLDNDGSGFIEYQEFIRATIDKKTLFTEFNLRQAFDLFDHDKSGSISFEEIKNIIGKKLPEDVAKQLWTETNEGKEINFEDFKALMNSLEAEAEDTYH